MKWRSPLDFIYIYKESLILSSFKSSQLNNRWKFFECFLNHPTFNKRNKTFFKVKYFSVKLAVRHCVFELQFCCYITWTLKLFLAHYCVFNPGNLTKNIEEYIYRIEETTGTRWRSDLRWNRRVKCRTAAILKSSHPGISTQSYTITNRPGVCFSKDPVTFRARNQIFKSKYKE